MLEQPQADALACLSHEQANGYLPSGGWGWLWGPDSDRGFGKRQPGGWHFSILSYMGLDNLHDMSLGQNYKALTDMVATPVGTFICPSRRQAIAYPYNCNPGSCSLLQGHPPAGITITLPTAETAPVREAIRQRPWIGLGPRLLCRLRHDERRPNHGRVVGLKPS